jgi:hypothetical protein
MSVRDLAGFRGTATGFGLGTELRAVPPLFSLAGLFLLLGATGSLPAQVPYLINYQGKVTAAGASFSGVGQFKFALVSGVNGGTLWSNDGSSTSGAEPNQAVAVAVTQGLFSVTLGDASLSNMVPVTPALFTNPDVRLRIWFNDGTNGSARLSPDQRLGASAYAMMAANLPDGALTSSKLAPGAVQTANLANGAVTSAQLAPNSVTIPALLSGAVTAPKLAAGAVTAAAIADGTVSQAKLNFQLGYLNPRNPPYGAQGNGVTDDTAAIQSALNDAGTQGGGIVFLPAGDYRIRSHLLIPAQTTLSGVARAPTAMALHHGTTLLAEAGAGGTSGVPFITLLGNNPTLEGVTIYYPNQVATNPPIPYPWAIRAGGGENVTVQNVLLLNPYLGIDLATYPSARHLVRGVYGQPLLVGIAVDQCYDIGRIMDIHFWPFWSQDSRLLAFISANAVTFDFMRTDWEVVQDVFSWGYSIGARFRASASGAMNGQMSNINFDNVDIGLLLTATQPYAIHIANLNLANAGGGTHHIGIQALPGASELNVNGVTFWGLIRQPVTWGSSGLLTLSNARVLGWSATNPAISILQGRAVLQGNSFLDNIGVAIHVGPAANRVMILGNMLNGNTLSLSGPNTLSANNQP